MSAYAGSYVSCSVCGLTPDGIDPKDLPDGWVCLDVMITCTTCQKKHDDEMAKRRAARRGNSLTPEALTRTEHLKPHLDAHAEWLRSDRSKPFQGHQHPVAPKAERQTHARGAHPEQCRYCRAQLIVDQVNAGTLPHEHKPAERPDDCHICHAQRTEAEGH